MILIKGKRARFGPQSVVCRFLFKNDIFTSIQHKEISNVELCWLSCHIMDFFMIQLTDFFKKSKINKHLSRLPGDKLLLPYIEDKVVTKYHPSSLYLIGRKTNGRQ